jgi:dihydrofolate reductase
VITTRSSFATKAYAKIRRICVGHGQHGQTQPATPIRRIRRRETAASASEEGANIAGHGTSYTFVTGGVAAAVEQARAIADGKDVLLVGGVSISRQALAAGPVDEVVLLVVPKLVGRGVRLFDADEVDLRCIETIEGEGAVHLRYEVR